MKVAYWEGETGRGRIPGSGGEPSQVLGENPPRSTCYENVLYRASQRGSDRFVLILQMKKLRPIEKPGLSDVAQQQNRNQTLGLFLWLLPNVLFWPVPSAVWELAMTWGSETELLPETRQVLFPP
jgi:hypothetical protein